MGFHSEEVVMGTTELMTPVFPMALCLVVDFTPAGHMQNNTSRSAFTCPFNTSCGCWLLFTSLTLVKQLVSVRKKWRMEG